MLPMVALALFCGLLAQNAQGYANPDATAHLSPELLRQMIEARIDRPAIINRLQSLRLEDMLKSNIKHSSGIGILGEVPIFGDAISHFYANILGVKITNVELLDLDIHFDGVEKRIFLTVPAELEVDIDLPFSLGSLLRVQLSVDVQVGVQTFINPTDGHLKLELGNCQNNPGHVRVTLLDKETLLLKAVNDILRIVRNVLETKLPDILEKELCPLVNKVVQNILDLIQASWPSKVQGETVKISGSTFIIHRDSLEIGYKGEIQLADGENYEIPPISTPLPDVPLSAGSSINMLFSENFISSIVLAALPPETFKTDNRFEVANFNKRMGSIPEFSMPAGARIGSLEISYWTPALSLTTGLVEMYQEMQLAAFGNYQQHSNINLFTIKMKALFHAEVSTEDLVLSLSFKLQSLHGVSLENSAIGTFDPLYLNAAMKSVLSNTFTPHVNSLLSGGCRLWVMQELGVEEVNISIGEHMLLLTASSPY